MVCVKCETAFIIIYNIIPVGYEYIATSLSTGSCRTVKTVEIQRYICGNGKLASKDYINNICGTWLASVITIIHAFVVFIYGIFWQCSQGSLLKQINDIKRKVGPREGTV